jgi:hypothetical protein
MNLYTWAATEGSTLHIWLHDSTMLVQAMIRVSISYLVLGSMPWRISVGMKSLTPSILGAETVFKASTTAKTKVCRLNCDRRATALRFCPLAALMSAMGWSMQIVIASYLQRRGREGKLSRAMPSASASHLQSSCKFLQKDASYECSVCSLRRA